MQENTQSIDQLALNTVIRTQERQEKMLHKLASRIGCLDDQLAILLRRAQLDRGEVLAEMRTDIAFCKAAVTHWMTQKTPQLTDEWLGTLRQNDEMIKQFLRP